MARRIRMLLCTAAALAACAAEERVHARSASAPRLAATELSRFDEPPGRQDYVMGTAAGAAEVTIFADASLKREIAWGKVGADGSFGPLEIGDDAYPRVWVVVSNAAGSSAAVALDEDPGIAPDPDNFSVRFGQLPVIGSAKARTAATQIYTASTSACLVFTCDEAGGISASPLDGASFDGRTIPEWTKAADDSLPLAVHFPPGAA